MSMHELLLAKCQLCSCDQPPLRTAFKQLRRQMAALLARRPPTPSPQPPDSEAFLQLLRVMGLDAEDRQGSSRNCKHLRLFKMLQKSLNCNSHTLHHLCEITAATLAEKNYTLAILEAQIKNAADRIASEVPVAVKEEHGCAREEMFASQRTLPSEKEIREPTLPATFPSTTSLEEVEQGVPAFPFYFHLPLFFAGQ